MSFSCSLLWLLVVWSGTSIGKESYDATEGPSWMTASSFCPSSSNSWILQWYILNAVPEGHVLVTDPTVIGTWEVEKQRMESKSSGISSLIYLHGSYVLSLYFFSPHGHLGQWISLVSYITNFNSWYISTTNTWKIWKFPITDSSYKVDTKGKTHWLSFCYFSWSRQIHSDPRLSELQR